jgi:acyl carrier protein
MTDRDALLDRILAIVARVVGPKRTPPPDIGAHTPLGDDGLWLDSVELLQVVIACEAEFGITFDPATDLVGGGLSTLGTLADLIHGKNPRVSSA